MDDTKIFYKYGQFKEFQSDENMKKGFYIDKTQSLRILYNYRDIEVENEEKLDALIKKNK